MIQTIITLAASGFGLWAFFKYFVFIEIRIDQNSFKVVYDISKDSKIFILEEEFTHEYRYPVIFYAICFFRKCPWFYISHEERILSAGFESKDHVSKIICFRWNYGKIKNYLKQAHKITSDVPVDLLGPGYSDKIGQIKKIDMSPIITNPLCSDFEKEVDQVSSKQRMKTSSIFFGPPGNGKTSFVKYLSIKYDLPIKIITFNPDWTNYDLLILFSQIPKNCIVLLEDFDNYFDGRKCIIGNDNKSIKFTFDIILNALDGIYNTYENVVFIMTTNDIEKIDYSLKNRPSRFKYIVEFYNPDYTLRQSLLKSDEYAQKTEGFNLDQIIRIKEFVESGNSIEDSLSKIY